MGYGAGLFCASLAVGLTYYIPLFAGIPWTLSFFAIATASWVGGVLPALVAALLTTCGIYALILAPASRHSHVPTSFAHTVAFDLIALLIAYLVSQRNRAMSALVTSEMHYRSVTETASGVVITIDSKSRILSINPAVKAVFGYEPSELIGEEMLILMPEKYRTAHTCGIAKYLATGVRHIPWPAYSFQADERTAKRFRSRSHSGLTPRRGSSDLPDLSVMFQTAQGGSCLDAK